MRDVTPGHTPQIDVNEILNFLTEYVKHPIQKISKLPEWNWPSLITVHVIISILSGVLAGLLKFNFYRVAFGIFLMPLVSTVSAMMMTLFLYYYFQFFENRIENFRKLFTLVVLSSIPFYIFQIISEYFSFVSIIGFSFSSLISIVGLCENFNLQKKRAYATIGFVFALVVLTWISNKMV